MFQSFHSDFFSSIITLIAPLNCSISFVFLILYGHQKLHNLNEVSINIICVLLASYVTHFWLEKKYSSKV